MKVSCENFGYYNEHGANNGFLRVVFTNPPVDNRAFIQVTEKHTTKPKVIPLSECEISAEFIAEDRLIEISDNDFLGAVIAFQINDEIFVGNYDGVMLTITERLKELDDLPVLQFSIIDQLAPSTEVSMERLMRSFKSAKKKIAERFGHTAAVNWQNTQILMPKINKVMSTGMVTSISLNSSGNDNYLHATVNYEARKNRSLDKALIDKEISKVVSRYNDNLLLKVTYVEKGTQMRSTLEPEDNTVGIRKVVEGRSSIANLLIAQSKALKEYKFSLNENVFHLNNMISEKHSIAEEKRLSNVVAFEMSVLIHNYLLDLDGSNLIDPSELDFKHPKKPDLTLSVLTRIVAEHRGASLDDTRGLQREISRHVETCVNFGLLEKYKIRNNYYKIITTPRFNEMMTSFYFRLGSELDENLIGWDKLKT